ncbi:SDR family oxidoreductase [Labrys wisconsinensis]|uniref:SDR family oxidoreductase n=1 Tax=Labrys wisconsinensis TaxID=425677 RepID=UPI003521F7CB
MAYAAAPGESRTRSDRVSRGDPSDRSPAGFHSWRAWPFLLAIIPVYYHYFTIIAHWQTIRAEFGEALCLAVDLAPVRVNCVCPGLIETEIWSAFPEGYRERLTAMAQKQLVPRPRQPAEAAGPI